MTSFITGFVLTNYYQDDQIKKDETGGQCRTHEQIRNVYKISVSKPDGKRFVLETKLKMGGQYSDGFLLEILYGLNLNAGWIRKGAY